MTRIEDVRKALSEAGSVSTGSGGGFCCHWCCLVAGSMEFKNWGRTREEAQRATLQKFNAWKARHQNDQD